VDDSLGALPRYPASGQAELPPRRRPWGTWIFWLVVLGLFGLNVHSLWIGMWIFALVPEALSFGGLFLLVIFLCVRDRLEKQEH
jgi:hypothetical protein